MITNTIYPLRSLVEAGETSGGSPTAKDDTEASSTSESTTGSTDTSTTGKAADAETKKEPTLQDAVAKIVADATKEGKEDSSTSESKAEQESASTIDKDKESESAEEGSEKKETPETADEGPVPYERFKEVNEAKSTLEAKVQEYEPLAQAQQGIATFCEQNSITPEQFQQGMQMLALVNTNPMEAKKMLEPIWNQLSGLTGDQLPADLAKKVEDGVIDEETAREVARLRGQTQVSDAQRKLNEERAVKSAQQQHIKQVADSITQWGTAKQAKDPDFKPKSGPNAKDGKYEVFSDKLYRLMAGSFPKTVADAVKLAEQAYADASGLFDRFGKRTVSSPKLNSSKSTSNSSNSEPKSATEAVTQMLAAKHGIKL